MRLDDLLGQRGEEAGAEEDSAFEPRAASTDVQTEFDERLKDERFELVRAVILHDLPARAGFVLTERLIHEKRFREIAGKLHISENAARQSYARALLSVRKILQRRETWASWRGWLALLSVRAGRRPPPGAQGDHIGCTVFGPRAVGRKDRCLIQVYVHALEDAGEALRTALEFDETAARLGAKTLDLAVSVGTPLTFSLTLPGLPVDERNQSLTWYGHTDSVSFGVEIPDDCPPGVRIGTVLVLVNAVPVGRIKFRVVITARQHYDAELLKPMGEEARRFTQAFISYASEDRNKVLARVQMLRLLGIKYFQDVLDLEPGQRWEKQLYRHIDECDLFLLFWSAAASASQWVLREVRYAVQRKGGDEDAPPAIHPVIIEGPPIVPPPPELEHLHFNDRLLYFMTPDTPEAPSA